MSPSTRVETRSEPAQGDDVSALFRRIFASEHGYVFHTLRRHGVAERDLEDLTHDVFLVVHRKLADYDRLRPVRPWLCAIAARAASDYRKLARNRNERVEPAHEPPDAAPGPHAQAEASSQRALVARALEAVEPDRRSVLVMVDIDELPVPEVASILEIPLNTAYSRLRLARQEFAAAVRRLQAKRGGS